MSFGRICFARGREERRDLGFDGLAHLRLTEERIVRAVEFAEIFLREVARTKGAAFLFEEGGGNARAVGGRDAEAGPFLAGGPLVVEESALAVGRAKEPEAAAADREHGTKGAIEFIGHARGFIDEHER